MEDFKDLRVWTKAHELTLFVYKQTFPIKDLRIDEPTAARLLFHGSEHCGKVGRRSDAEMKTFLQVARGSASEVEDGLLLAKDLQFLTADEFHDLRGRVLEVGRMPASLVQRADSDCS